MSERKGDWFQTYTGKAFWPMDPRPEDICIADIAHGLSLQCRYNGHTKDFYSVAQHSVLVSRHCESMTKNRIDCVAISLWGLLHDAAESYLGDMVRPLKRSMPAYRDAEYGVMVAVCKCFGLGGVEPPEIKTADTVLLATERRDLMGPAPLPWDSIENIEPLPESIVGWPFALAEVLFLCRFEELTHNDTTRTL
jgi:hypothetical protein